MAVFYVFVPFLVGFWLVATCGGEITQKPLIHPHRLGFESHQPILGQTLFYPAIDNSLFLS